MFVSLCVSEMPQLEDERFWTIRVIHLDWRMFFSIYSRAGSLGFWVWIFLGFDAKFWL